MPSHKKIKSQPHFAFVTLGSQQTPISWLKIHSGATRSHAAYWGGPVKHQRQEKQQTAEQQNDELTSTSASTRRSSSSKDLEPTSRGIIAGNGRRRRPNKPKIAKANFLLCRPRAEFLPRHLEHDNIQQLPSFPSNIKAAGSSFAAASTFAFLGESFVRQFMLLDHEDHAIMFAGTLLLSYAYSMALTGHGTKTVLLELKSNVIRSLAASMRSSGGVLSPCGLMAILALASPIVCLVSQDLPRCLGMWDYLMASMRDDYLCCRESAETAQYALQERIVHRQAMRRLFADSIGKHQDAHSFALLQWVSNLMNIYMAVEAANHLDTPLENVDGLFPDIDASENCFISSQWTSPLTRQWSNETAATPMEARMLLLGKKVHDWLATFFDGDSLSQQPTKESLTVRANLRLEVESFAIMKGTSNMEKEAMYESCRWAGMVLLVVEDLHVPIYVAARKVRIQPRLVRRLRMTDLSNLWGLHKGLLFWVTSVCHFSTAGQCFPLLDTTILGRFAQEIAMSERCFEIAIKPLKRLKLFESLCCRAV